MKTVYFEKNAKPHIIPKEAVLVIIGYQDWAEGCRLGKDGYVVTMPGGTVFFIEKDDALGFTDDRSDGSQSYRTVLLTAMTRKWQRVNGMTLKYQLCLGGADFQFTTSMRLVYGYVMAEENDAVAENTQQEAVSEDVEETVQQPEFHNRRSRYGSGQRRKQQRPAPPDPELLKKQDEVLRRLGLL